jgi:hypothetical protein
MTWLHDFADIASIITASIAAVAYGNYRWTIFRRQRSLESVLSKKSLRGPDSSLTLQQLAAYANLTEDQVVEATANSKKIGSFEGNSKEHRYRYRNRGCYLEPLAGSGRLERPIINQALCAMAQTLLSFRNMIASN